MAFSRSCTHRSAPTSACAPVAVSLLAKFLVLDPDASGRTSHFRTRYATTNL